MRASHFDAGCAYVMDQEGPDYEYEEMIEKERIHVWKCLCQFCQHFDDPDLMSMKYIENYYTMGYGWNPFCSIDADNDGHECEGYRRRV